MTEYRLNAYHIMWMFVFFDLPVTTKKERKAALLPATGKVSILSVTDKQFGDIYNFWGKPKNANQSKIHNKVISEPIQLEFF